MEYILKNSSEFTNYDFAENWDKISALFTDKSFFNNLYRPIVKEYKKIYGDYDKRNTKTLVTNKLIPPYELSGGDGTTIMCNEIYEKFIVKRDQRIPCEMWSLYESMEQSPFPMHQEEYLNNYVYHKWKNTFRAEVMKKINLDWDHNINSIHHWIPVCRCHFYNKHFGLMVAKKLMPDKKWEVVTTGTHTTVVCFEDKLFFDILIWGSRNLTTYMNNIVFDEKTPYVDNKTVAQNIIYLLNDYKN